MIILRKKRLSEKLWQYAIFIGMFFIYPYYVDDIAGHICLQIISFINFLGTLFCGEVFFNFIYIVDIFLTLVLTIVIFHFIISQKYSNPHINWKQQLPDIPSHIGESVYPGVRLVTLSKSIPGSVLNSTSNTLPNSVPNSIPISSHNDARIDIQVSVPKDQHVDAPITVGIKQTAVNR